MGIWIHSDGLRYGYLDINTGGLRYMYGYQDICIGGLRYGYKDIYTGGLRYGYQDICILTDRQIDVYNTSYH